MVSKDGVVLDSTVNGSVVCTHGRLGLRPLARVVQVWCSVAETETGR